jgi:hypothetical protein
MDGAMRKLILWGFLLLVILPIFLPSLKKVMVATMWAGIEYVAGFPGRLIHGAVTTAGKTQTKYQQCLSNAVIEKHLEAEVTKRRCFNLPSPDEQEKCMYDVLSANNSVDSAQQCVTKELIAGPPATVGKNVVCEVLKFLPMCKP